MDIQMHWVEIKPEVYTYSSTVRYELKQSTEFRLALCRPSPLKGSGKMVDPFKLQAL